jgi:hypothetical protein
MFAREDPTVDEKPVTLFSARIDPEGVLDVLRKAGATVDVQGSPWAEGTASWKPGFFSRRIGMHIRNDPVYYGDESFSQQLPGMTRFVLGLGAPERFLAAIRSFRFAVSMIPGTRDAGDARWKAVLAVAAHLDAVIVTPTTFLDAQGRAIVRTDGPPDPDAVSPAYADPNPILVPKGNLYRRDAVTDREPPPHRAASVETLTAAGFTAPWWLPGHTPALRPAEEIARRLMALNGLFAWVTAPEDRAASVLGYLDDNGLREALSGREAALLANPSARASHQGTIGWKLENMWALAWVLGHEPAPLVTDGMMGHDAIGGVISFVGGLTRPLSEVLARATPRSEDEVAAMEDLYYAAHHAVRSAQMARATVPRGFHPAIHGGIIHERRHALTWAISAGVAWDDTDLST